MGTAAAGQVGLERGEGAELAERSEGSVHASQRKEPALGRVPLSVRRFPIVAAGNHDPAVFENPDVLDIERDCRETMVFGHGPHYCLGANLARQEMGCMLEAALDIIRPGSRLREDEMEFQPMGLFKRPLNLPIEIGRS